MNSKQRASVLLNYMQEEGRRDRVFFGQIIGMVSYDLEDCPYDKSTDSRFNDALLFAKYLVNERGFDFGKATSADDGEVVYIPYSQLDDFEREVRLVFSNNGIDDIQIQIGFWFRFDGPISHIDIPRYITEIFQ